MLEPKNLCKLFSSPCSRYGRRRRRKRLQLQICQRKTTKARLISTGMCETGTKLAAGHKRIGQKHIPGEIECTWCWYQKNNLPFFTRAILKHIYWSEVQHLKPGDSVRPGCRLICSVWACPRAWCTFICILCVCVCVADTHINTLCYTCGFLFFSSLSLIANCDCCRDTLSFWGHFAGDC